MQLDVQLINSNLCDRVVIHIEDNSGLNEFECLLTYDDGEEHQERAISDSLSLQINPEKDVTGGLINFYSESGAPDVVIMSVSYLKDGAVVGSSLVQNGSCELKLLKYKVELPRGAKVTLFNDESLEAQFVAWNLPCPNTLPNMTFLQVKAANGFEQQITPSAGSYSVEVWTELGRRYAVFSEIWTYSFAQTLWFADLKVQLSNYDWVDVVPTAGEGGTIVTALPQ